VGAPDPWPFAEGKKVILYVGSEQPRKNLPVLLRAVSLVKESLQDILFVKVGRPQWKGAREGLVVNLKNLGLERDVVFLDYVHEDELPLLYNRADVFVFPSLYEGFGLPPLEAMACGCPVVAAGTSSLPEVLGDAGVLVSPDDEEEMAGAILQILTDEALRAELSERGLARASGFTWAATARRTIETYLRIVDDG
jgi:glycosyltransferase involved in cell wall biosynthesis